ncbi:MAG: glycine cleavage system protein GcvH [Chloroflexi bacterium]|nr:glycine cleavage system protein GcvH [Chloroflexota bacterium]
MSPEDLRYSKEHEWVRVEDTVGTIGITAYAQDQLGDVVFVNLPEVGSSVQQFAKFGEIESVKAVSDLFSPVSGEVVERNEALFDRPELVNQEPYGQGWLVKVRMTNPADLDDLLTGSQYDELIGAAG